MSCVNHVLFDWVYVVDKRLLGWWNSRVYGIELGVLHSADDEFSIFFTSI
jgi:hypothetical protein